MPSGPSPSDASARVNDSLADLGVPVRAAGAIERGRVAEALRRAMRHPVTLIAAPAGFGKSAAVAALTDATVCRLPPIPGTLAEVAHALARAFAPSRGGLDVATAATLRAAGSGDPAPALAAWLAELAAPGATIVLDDLDDALAVPSAAAAIAGLVERTARDVRWVLAARSPDAFPLARWMADGLVAVPIDEAVLGLQPDEVRRLLAARGVERAALPNVEMRLATVALCCDLVAAGTARRAVASHARSLRHAAQLAFDGAGEDERRLLAFAVHLPCLSAGALGLLPVDGAPSAYAHLRRRLPAALGPAAIATWFRAELRDRVAGDPRYAAVPAEAREVWARLAARPASEPQRDAAREELHRAAAALASGRADDADAAARRAVALAEEGDAYDVAAQAFATLLELARDAGEPAAELGALEQLERLAGLAGEHDLRAAALGRAHALLAERGEAEGMERAQTRLAFVAPAAAERAARAMLAGRALALAWDSDFASAHALLAGTAAGETEAAGRALRAAEIALYAAATDLRAESNDAAAAAEGDLYQVTESAVRDRVLASLALAATLSGDDAAALRRLPRTPAGESSRRTAVLLDAVVAYRRRAHGQGSPAEQAAALERARSRGFGGFARLIEALEHGPRGGAAAPRDDVAASIEHLLGALASHDALSAVHARAVGAWCERIARRLGLDAGTALFARRCGLLHDVGKTYVPADLLAAPRGLDAEELVLVQAHAVLGERALLAHGALAPFASAARSHHERYDGRGYPDRLAGERIPLAARVVAVADAFDAMIAPRPYRAPRAPSAALMELHRERGRQFDPDVVDAMIAVVEGHG